VRQEAADLGPVLLTLARGEVIRLPFWRWAPDISVGMAWLLVALWAAAGAGLLLGWRSRWTGALLVAVMAAVLLLDQQLYSNHFYLLILLSLLVTAADSGAALSLDALRVGERRGPLPCSSSS
jgi:hypothetical protein